MLLDKKSMDVKHAEETNQQLNKEILKLNKNLSEYSSEINRLKFQYKNLEQQLESKIHVINQLQKDLENEMLKSNKQNEKLITISDECKTINNQFQEKCSQLLTQNEKNQFLESQIVNLDRLYTELKQSHIQANQDIMNYLILNREQLNSKLQLKESEIQTLLIKCKEIDNAQNVSIDLHKRLHLLQNEMDNQKLLFEAKQVENANLEQKCKHIEQYSENMKASLETWKNEYQKISTQLGQLMPFKSQHKDLESAKLMLEQEVERLKMQLNQKIDENDFLQNELVKNSGEKNLRQSYQSSDRGYLRDDPINFDNFRNSYKS